MTPTVTSGYVSAIICGTAVWQRIIWQDIEWLTANSSGARIASTCGSSPRPTKLNHLWLASHISHQRSSSLHGGDTSFNSWGQRESCQLLVRIGDVCMRNGANNIIIQWRTQIVQRVLCTVLGHCRKVLWLGSWQTLEWLTNRLHILTAQVEVGK